LISRRHLGPILAVPALIFYIVVKIRNLLFDYGILKSIKPEVPSIVIGNITVGGTGKTPMIEYIIRNLHPTVTPIVISRGYGRKTKGFRVVETSDTPDLCGDEPLQIKKMFPHIMVIVCERRAKAVEILKAGNHFEINTVLLFDDAFQHRAIRAGLNIVLADHNRLPFSDYMLPWGNLREPLSGLNRADAIVVTKCPENPDKGSIIKKLKVGSKPVIFAKIVYGSPYPLFPESNSNWETTNASQLIMVSALAEPRAFNAYGKTLVAQTEELAYPDHYFFTTNDVADMVAKLSTGGSAKAILTTAKDAVKLRQFAREFGNSAAMVFVVPIKTEIIFDKTHFNNIINNNAH
jgi:tetraacyldisaccharide 4'-kinase